MAWHRGFRLFGTWKSRHRTGRPTVARGVRALIGTMSAANPLWGAPRIHGELLKLAFTVSQTTVAKYMVRRPPSLADLARGSCARRWQARWYSTPTRRATPALNS